MAVRWHEGGLTQQARLPERLRPDTDFPFEGLQPGQSPRQLGLAVALNPGDADDLAAPGLEADIAKAAPGRLRTVKMGAPVAAILGGKVDSSVRPTISRRRSSLETSSTRPPPRTLPSRNTVTRCAIWRISASRWVM